MSTNLQERTGGQWWQIQGNYVTVKLDSVRKLLLAAYRDDLGMSPDDAKFYMDIWLDKAIQGDHARGFARILSFVQAVRDKRINVKPQIKVMQETSNFALVDGGDLAAQPLVAKAAMDLAIKKARNGGGIAFSGCRAQSQILTAHLKQAIEADMIGIIFTQSFPTVAPYGGAGPLFGNAPVGFAIPAGKHDPIIFDASLTNSSASGMFLAAKQKEKVAPQMLLDRHGMPTTDATEFPDMDGYMDPTYGPDAAGSLTGLGDNHKGYGLVFLTALLSYVLTDTSAPWELFYRVNKDRKALYGSVYIAIDPKVVMPLDKFKGLVDGFIDHTKGHPRRKGVDEILYPGEKSQRLKRERNKVGMISIPESHFKGLCDVADLVGLPRPELAS
jgi:LDH2 family malate/lactate/ureidoglycolate dehydrogenase